MGRINKELKIVGSNLRKIRTKAHFTQADVAFHLSVNRYHYGRIEIGKVNPKLIFLISFCRFFKIEPSQIFNNLEI